MKAITTTFHGATETRGAHIKARAEGVRALTTSYDYGAADPHLDAARALAERMNWAGTYVGGGLPDGKSRVFVCLYDDDRDRFTVARRAPPC